MIDDNVSMETDLDQVTGQCSDEYWSKRYTIKSHNVPEFLEPVQEIILRTGKYLNVIRQCNELCKYVFRIPVYSSNSTCKPFAIRV